MFELVDYRTVDGHDPYQSWLRRLKDGRAQAAIIRRLIRVEQGNFGDHKHCANGVWELRIDLGPGYRVYYGLVGTKIVLLLAGGDKGSQQADIGRAVANFEDWKGRQDERS